MDVNKKSKKNPAKLYLNCNTSFSSVERGFRE
jgi:hypothetical protein